MKIVYYSETGNTEAMAQYIKEGIETAGKAAELVTAENADAADILSEEVIILGCPAVGSEQVDEQYIMPLVENMGAELAGKKAVLFGSYGWGNGEWMEEWENIIKSYGAELIRDSLIVNEGPEGDDIQRLKEFGQKIAEV